MADKKAKPRGLGRGLSALMADVTPAPTETGAASQRADTTLPIEQVSPNPDQPRRDFSQQALEELAASIREKGIIQPLIVRPKNGAFEIVAGERRWRAAQLAQLHEVPVLIREFDDIEVLEVAIIENIQRADLNAIEEAAGYRQLMENFGHTQEKLAEALSKSRSHIANLLRLLNLPKEVQDMLRQGQISAGHARAIITAEDPAGLARRIVREGLSVREVEKIVRKAQEPKSTPHKTGKDKPSVEKDADTRALEGDLSANLGLKVTITHEPGGERGRLVLQYESLEQLDDLCRMLSGH